jgi:hypothetical protein
MLGDDPLDNDENYYSLRASMERDRGAAASDASAAAVHEGIARRYDALSKAVAKVRNAELAPDDAPPGNHPDWRSGGSRGGE